jgi:hypothetical protein
MRFAATVDLLPPRGMRSYSALLAALSFLLSFSYTAAQAPVNSTTLVYTLLPDAVVSPLSANTSTILGQSLKFTPFTLTIRGSFGRQYTPSSS